MMLHLLQKEELLKKEKHANGRVQQELNSLQKNHDIVKAELESIRMVAAIQESSKMDEIERVKRQCQEEVGARVCCHWLLSRLFSSNFFLRAHTQPLYCQSNCFPPPLAFAPRLGGIAQRPAERGCERRSEPDNRKIWNGSGSTHRWAVIDIRHCIKQTIRSETVYRGAHISALSDMAM